MKSIKSTTTRFVLLVLLLGWLPFASAAEQAPPPATSSSANREFGAYCAQGLAEGKRVTTDCSINWTAGDGRSYCFESDAMRTLFLENPAVNLEKARDFLASTVVESAGKLMNSYTGDNVKDFIAAYVKSMTREDGTFHFHDVSTSENLELVFVEFNLMRTLDGYGYFPDLVFGDRNDPAKKYWLDFWVTPRGSKLEVIDTRIYKGPKKVGEAWVMQSRSPKPWWWIPASEHPGKMEARRGWEVMSALETHIVAERAKNNGTFLLTDDKTGEKLVLDFIGTHQPVRKLDGDGRYFACTDFRRQGTTDEYYDVDFWIDEKTGTMSVDQVRVHKVPVKEDGTWIQVPRYNFDNLKFINVP